MAIDTRFRIASMTKPVTAVAALLLVEDGRLGLDDPVARYIPAAGALRVATSTDFGPDGSIPTAPISRPLTVRDLLNFRSGMGSANDESDLGRVWGERQFRSGEGSLGDRVDRVLTAPLYEQPGEQWRYGRSADVLARVVEVAADEPFDQFLQRRIFTPLGMDSTRYLPPLEERAGMATLYTQDENQDLVRVEGRNPGGLSWTPGGSGLVSTAGDYLRFALMLWNRGSYDGTRILAPETIAMMTQPHVPSGVLRDMGMEGLGWGLGIAVVVDPDATPFADRIFHVHAKDARVDQDRLNDVGILANPLEYHTPKLPGLGDVDWSRFFAVLGDTGYRGPVCVEVEDRVYEDSLASRERALRQSCTFLRNYIPREEPT